MSNKKDKVAYFNLSEYETGEEEGIYVIDVDGSNKNRVISVADKQWLDDPPNSRIAWSPDDTQLAIALNMGQRIESKAILLLQEVESGALKKIIRLPEFLDSSFIKSLHWSDDNAFYFTAHDQPDIYHYKMDDHSLTNLTANHPAFSGKVSAFDISPDGKKIAVEKLYDGDISLADLVDNTILENGFQVDA